MNVEQRDIINLIKDQLVISDDLTMEWELSDLPHWDSLRALRIMSALEGYADKKISLKDFLSSKTINDLFKLVK